MKSNHVTVIGKLKPFFMARNCSTRRNPESKGPSNKPELCPYDKPQSMCTSFSKTNESVNYFTCIVSFPVKWCVPSMSNDNDISNRRQSVTVRK